MILCAYALIPNLCCNHHIHRNLPSNDVRQSIVKVQVRGPSVEQMLEEFVKQTGP